MNINKELRPVMDKNQRRIERKSIEIKNWGGNQDK